MRIMSRDFTMPEKVLLVVLVLVLLGLVYYRFVDQTVRTTITANESEAAMLQTELNAVQSRLLKLNNIRRELDALEANDSLSWMPSYNNEKEEVAFLNDILADALKYSINFANVTRNGDQIRRSFTLQYTTADYKTAQDILLRLCQGKNRCLVGDLRCKADSNGTISFNAAATFYETLVGGTADAGLPKSSAAAK